jgi:phosphotriesterase-related protein
MIHLHMIPVKGERFNLSLSSLLEQMTIWVIEMEYIDGYTFMHEHIFVDLSGVKENPDCRLDCFADTVEEMKRLARQGVRNIVEVTNIGMGRNVEYMERVARESGMNLIYSTGFYKEPFYPEYVKEKTEDELAAIMIGDIVNGMDGTGIKASVIGEIGSSKNVIKPTEEKVFRAAAKAHLETGKVITTHTTLGTMGLEQIRLLKEMGVDVNRVIIGHVDLSSDLEYILRLIDSGVYVEFDTIGKNNYVPDETRADILAEIAGRGLDERVVLSLDITRKSHLFIHGGIGYTYLINHFLPMLKERGVRDQAIENMLRWNPQRILKGEIIAA